MFFYSCIYVKDNTWIILEPHSSWGLENRETYKKSLVIFAYGVNQVYS